MTTNREALLAMAKEIRDALAPESMTYRLFLELPNLQTLKDAKGKTWHFEWHNGCGLLMTNKEGDVIDGYPPEGSPFWPAFKIWDAGRRTGQGKPTNHE